MGWDPPEWRSGRSASNTASPGTPECRRAPDGPELSLFASPVTGCGPQALDLSTGGRPASIQDELLVVSAVVPAATLCVCHWL